MYVVYAPEDPADGDRQEWTFEPGRVRAAEGQALLREFGEKSWDLFVQGIKVNNLHARRVLLWHLLRRTHPLMRFSDTPDFYADEVTIDFSSKELTELLDAVRTSNEAPDMKAQLVAAFESEIEVALKREADEGKALTPTSTTESTTTG